MSLDISPLGLLGNKNNMNAPLAQSKKSLPVNNS